MTTAVAVDQLLYFGVAVATPIAEGKGFVLSDSAAFVDDHAWGERFATARVATRQLAGQIFKHYDHAETALRTAAHYRQVGKFYWYPDRSVTANYTYWTGFLAGPALQAGSLAEIIGEVYDIRAATAPTVVIGASVDADDGPKIDITNFTYLGVQYGAVSHVEEDQTDVLVAALAKAGAGPVKTVYVPKGNFRFAFLEASVNPRILQAGCRLVGDGEGISVIQGLPQSMADNIDQLGTGTLLLVESNTYVADITVDGRGDEVLALGAATVNRVNKLIDAPPTDPEVDDGVEHVLLERVELTGQYVNEVAATILTSNVGSAYQFTLAPDHDIAVDDTILARGHTGATFERYDELGTLIGTWAGNGSYEVTAIDGDNIQVVATVNGVAPVVAVAGTGGFIDNTTSRALEGAALGIGHGRYLTYRRVHAHHNMGSGIFALWRNRLRRDWGHTITLDQPHCHHNGWQGYSCWGVRDVTIIDPSCHDNDRNGLNHEYCDNVTVLGGVATNNGKSGGRAAGDGTGVTYVGTRFEHNGATEYETTYGPIQFPNDPDFSTAAQTNGTDVVVQQAVWRRLGIDRIGAPELVTLIGCTSTPAPGKYSIRAASAPGVNVGPGSLPRVSIQSDGDWTWHPDSVTTTEPDANASVYVRAAPRYPLLRDVQRVPLPPVTQWTTTAGASLATPTGSWTTGLTSTAGAVTTINGWTAHGFVTGDQVLLRGFAEVGSAQLNRDDPHTVTRVDDDTFTMDVPSTSNGTGGEGIDYRAEIAGCRSTLARTLILPTTTSHGVRLDLPFDQLDGIVRPRYKVVPSPDWWTTGITTTAGNPTIVNWTGHLFEDGDRIVFERMAGSDDVNINDPGGFRVTVVDANHVTFPLATTGAASGGRAARVANIASANIGIKHTPGGGDPTQSRWYPAISQQWSLGDLYRWHEPEIRSAPRATLPSSYQLAFELAAGTGGIANHRIVIDWIGDWHSLIGTAQGVWDMPDVLTATAAYAGTAVAEAGGSPIANNANGAQQTVTVTGAQPGDVVLADLDALAGLGASSIIAHVHAANSVRLRIRNLSGATLTVPAGTWNIVVLKAAR